MSVEKAKDALWTSLMHLQGDAMYSRKEVVNAVESLIAAMLNEGKPKTCEHRQIWRDPSGKAQDTCVACYSVVYRIGP